MAIYDKFEYDNMTLTEKQQIYRHFHLKNLIIMNILQVNKYYP